MNVEEPKWGEPASVPNDPVPPSNWRALADKFYYKAFTRKRGKKRKAKVRK